MAAAVQRPPFSKAPLSSSKPMDSFTGAGKSLGTRNVSPQIIAAKSGIPPTVHGGFKATPSSSKQADSFASTNKSLGARNVSTQSTQFIASKSGIPPTVQVGMIARDAVQAMNDNGNRFYSGAGSTSAWAGNIVDNARSMVGVRDKWWKCEDQAPFVADRINRANIPGVRAGVESSDSHSWVVVNVGGTADRAGNVSGGQNYYIDPWASGGGFVSRPGTPYLTVWDQNTIRGNIEPDGPR